MLGKLVHLTADALIISAFLAGIKRSTGLTSVPSSPLAVALVLTLTVLCLSSPALDKVPSKDLRCMSFHLPFILFYYYYYYFHRILTGTADWVITYLETGRLAPRVAAYSRSLCSLSSTTSSRRIHLRSRRRLPRPLVLL